MNDKLSNWITALEEIKDNILNTLNYNGDSLAPGTLAVPRR